MTNKLIDCSNLSNDVSSHIVEDKDNVKYMINLFRERSTTFD